MIIGTTWSSSPAGLTPSPPNYTDGVGGALHGFTDSPITARTACATGHPTIGSVVPSTGTIAGGTHTVIYGAGFSSSTSVTIGGVAGTAFSVLNEGVIDATSPASPCPRRAEVNVAKCEKLVANGEDRRRPPGSR
jgi:hypothetical protein